MGGPVTRNGGMFVFSVHPERFFDFPLAGVTIKAILRCDMLIVCQAEDREMRIIPQ
jgi:hypothetical protein